MDDPVWMPVWMSVNSGNSKETRKPGDQVQESSSYSFWRLKINTSLQTFFLIFFFSRSLVDLFYTWQKIYTPLMLKTWTFYLSKNCFPIFTILLLSLIYKAIANSKFILILRRKFVWFGRNKISSTVIYCELSSEYNAAKGNKNYFHTNNISMVSSLINI